ncbi:ABC transporter permease [Ruminococcus difficilis]|uniref:ABC transporter permease n=1 Tax=Ruminococcus difficilis TaxID=2763069 RepID=A0A934TXY9_9FIRM|nr:ABC transporter permease [Ruminococcus difficilis]MBK6087511.1 ABC transporter permease [Ruminococcus difficilis]
MLTRKLFRTAWGYKAQFISMILMITLGIGMFLGFNMEWKTIEADTGKFFEQTKYADYRLYSEKGFTKEDLDKISAIEGVDAATRYLSVNLDIKGEKNKSLALDVSENNSVSTFLVTQGAEYDKSGDGFWLSDKFAAANDYQIGDELVLSFQGTVISGEIVGLIKSGEHMICVADKNQMMPDYNTYGYAYISPKKLRSVLEVKIKSDFADELKQSNVPEEFIDDSLTKLFVTDEMLSDAADKVFAQVNLLSGLSKEALEDKIKNALGRTIMVTPKDDHVVYKEAMGEAEEGKTMGSVLPVLFLAIAILTMVTTMHRIATKEKTQIGTLKALGFKNRRILRHYTSYGLFIGLVGAGLGIALGYGVCKLIMSEDGMMGTYFDMPDWSAVIPGFCYPVLIGTVLLLTLISYLSVRQQLKGTAADALRPYSPKKMRKIFFERFRFWNKLSFGTKWNIRDLSRHKSRSAMTLFGIVGCMVLMVGGLGMRDTMSGFLELLDKDISNYTTKVNLIDDADLKKSKELYEELGGDWESLCGISMGGDTVTLDIIHNPNHMLNVIDEYNNRIELSDEGVYLCLRLKDKADIGDEIEFSPYGSKDTFKAKVLGYNRSVMTESVTMTEALADRLGIEYSISSIYTDKKTDEIKSSDLIAGKQDKTQLMETFNSFVQIMDSMVIILVVAAVILGVVVLYNLGIMSYVERSRELATLKVLGFRNRTIGKLLISQNIWLTVIGVIIGLPAGVGVLQWLLTALAGEYEMKLMLGALTYSVSILLTFGVSLLVGLMVAGKNKKIDMVEALKGTE